MKEALININGIYLSNAQSKALRQLLNESLGAELKEVHEIMNNNESIEKIGNQQNVQWKLQQDSLIALTKFILLVRSLSKVSLCDDSEINLSRLISALNNINELANDAHNIPTLISTSMMHFVTLASGNTSELKINKFISDFECELSLLKKTIKG